MEYEHAADAHICCGGHRTLIGGRTVGCDAVEAITVFGHLARDASIDDIDDATNRRRAEQKGGRSPQDFDTLSQKRVDDDRVIDRCVRHVDRTDTICQDADALSLEASEDCP